MGADAIYTKNMYARCVADRFFRGEPFYLVVPEAFCEELQAGCMVMLLSRKGQGLMSTGYILNLSPDLPDDMDEAELPAVELVDLLNGGEPLLSSELLQITNWIADYYVTRHIEAIHTAIPVAIRTTVYDVAEIANFTLQAESAKVVSTGLRRSIMKLLATEKQLTVTQLQRRLGKKQLYKTLSQLEKGGYLTLSKKFSTKKPKVKTAYRLKAPLQEEVLANVASSKKQHAALTTLAALYPDTAFLDELGVSPAVMQVLLNKGLVEKVPKHIESIFSSGYHETTQAAKKPTAQQQQVLEALCTATKNGRYQTFLLHGVTGSGKTLVYIEFLKEILASGKTAIVLVPEISLTPQTAGRFREHFHNDIAILHSAMSLQEKYDAWHSLKSGRCRIALGARSTLFAPLENLGAIIVDEEHDGAYKQDRSPRYHARDTAVMRAMLSNAICLLGSATPSFESYQNAQNGKYRLLRMADRIDGATMPSVSLIWMRESPRRTTSISEMLYRQIAQRIEKNEQVILLQNRRGFAGSILCLECGHIPLCPHCNIPLVYHATHNHLRCHYCGHTERYKAMCSACKSTGLFYKGSGTERIEEELQKLFPDEKILRMDVDTTAKKGAHGRILREFHERKARILLGTQMVAKGLDFPAVTLVGVLMGDMGLNIPDFRASERTFALLMQVAGRAGRAAIPGEVLIQVYNKESAVFTALLHGDYERFFEQELESRRTLLYPPAARLIKFECSADDEVQAEAAANFCKEIVQQHLPKKQGMVLGPAPAGIAKIRNRFRYHVLVKLMLGKLSPLFIREMSDTIHSRFRAANVLLTVDVDPQSLM